MFLKLRTGREKNLGWKLIGNVLSVDYKYVDEPKELPAGTRYINTYHELPNKRVTEITIYYKSGPREILYTDDMVYILNDDGKTCDTINI